MINMNPFLFTKINKLLRSNRPAFSSDSNCTYYHENNYLEISFDNGQCTNDLYGLCTMCDYGIAPVKTNVLDFTNDLKKIYYSFSEEITSLMLCTNGSFLDDRQIPEDFQRKILEEANKLPCDTILLETHYNTVTETKLHLISNILVSKKVKIEMGLETTNPLYQNYILNKPINLLKFEDTILQILKYDFTPSVNILVGLPLLNIKEQINDAVQSIEWCIRRKTEIVLFPLNIKPYTLVFHLYQKKIIQPISQWLLIYVLTLIDERYLDRIDLAYWGNRKDSSDDEKIIFPQCCPICENEIINFYNNYSRKKTWMERKNLLNEIIMSTKCQCFNNIKKQAENTQNDKNIYDRLSFVYKYLESEFKGELY